MKEEIVMSHTSLPPVPFYFIRHGETEWNYEQRIMGKTDIPLSSVGIAQAHQASKNLEGLRLEYLISSPLLRAKQTADILGSYLKISPITNEDLAEICWGEWEGKKRDEGYDFNKWVKGYTPQGAESCIVFQERVMKAFSSILSANKNTLIVAHNGVYWALMSALGYSKCNARRECSTNCVKVTH